MLCCKPLGIFASVFNIFLMYAYICMYVHTANIYFYIRFLMTIQFLKTNIRFLSSITIMIFPFNSQSILLSLRYSVLQAVFIDCITGSPYPLASGWISKRYTGRRLEEKMGSILGCFFNLGLGGRISFLLSLSFQASRRIWLLVVLVLGLVNIFVCSLNPFHNL